MPLIEKITVRGFRSIARIENLPLQALNILVGANGSGKSNFVELFSFLRAVRAGQLQEYVMTAGGAERLLHFGSKNTESIYVDIDFANQVNGYKLDLHLNEEDRLFPYTEEVRFWSKENYAKAYTESLSPRSRGLEAGISSPDVRRIADWVRSRLGSWRLYHFEDTTATSALRKTATLEDNRYLRADGSNLAAYLYYLQEAERPAYNLIRKTVQRVAPFFDDFRLAPSRLNPEAIRLEWVHKGSEAYFDVASFSDGTLRFIALATLMLQPASHLPSLILLDEPELGLHPYAIELLGSLLHQVSRRTQVIAATQSTLLLDSMDPDNVLVATRNEGGTDVARLDGQRLQEWLQVYSLGQLWEKNEFAGRPAAE